MSESKYKVCDGNCVTLYIAEKIYYGEMLQGFRFVDMQDKTVYKFEYTYNKYRKKVMYFFFKEKFFDSENLWDSPKSRP